MNENAKQAMNPEEPPLRKRLGLLVRLDRFFGFGITVLDPRVLCYATGTGITGLGGGAFIARTLDSGTVQFDVGGQISIALVVLGGIVANVSHGSLRREAENAARDRQNSDSAR